MSDLIRREDVINALVEKGQSSKRYKLGEFWELNLPEIIDAIDAIPSADPERTAKVIKHKYWLGVSLNVVGEHTIGYEWLCENCKKKVLDGEDYCSHCGAKLLWGEENDSGISQNSV